MFYYILDIISKFILCFGAIAAYLIYFWNKSSKKRASASLIIFQIEKLKNNITSLWGMTGDVLYENFETVNIYNNNQWEINKHLFIKDIDSNSFKVIDSFYEYILCINEQLLLLKTIQQESFKDNQRVLIENCNSFLNRSLEDESFDIVENKNNLYSNANKYIAPDYYPKITINVINKYLDKLKFIEILGCDGFRKIKKISKIK